MIRVPRTPWYLICLSANVYIFHRLGCLQLVKLAWKDFRGSTSSIKSISNYTGFFEPLHCKSCLYLLYSVSYVWLVGLWFYRLHEKTTSRGVQNQKISIYRSNSNWIRNFKFGNSEWKLKYPISNWSNSVMRFFKSKISISNSQFEFKIEIGIRNSYFDFKSVFHIYI